jgi:hypothetical protein
MPTMLQDDLLLERLCDKLGLFNGNPDYQHIDNQDFKAAIHMILRARGSDMADDTIRLKTADLLDFGYEDFQECLREDGVEWKNIHIVNHLYDWCVARDMAQMSMFKLKYHVDKVPPSLKTYWFRVSVNPGTITES